MTKRIYGTNEKIRNKHRKTRYKKTQLLLETFYLSNYELKHLGNQYVNHSVYKGYKTFIANIQ